MQSSDSLTLDEACALFWVCIDKEGMSPETAFGQVYKRLKVIIEPQAFIDYCAINRPKELNEAQNKRSACFTLSDEHVETIKEFLKEIEQAQIITPAQRRACVRHIKKERVFKS